MVLFQHHLSGKSAIFLNSLLGDIEVVDVYVVVRQHYHSNVSLCSAFTIWLGEEYAWAAGTCISYFEGDGLCCSFLTEDSHQVVLKTFSRFTIFAG